MESTVTPAPSRSTRPHISWPKVRSCGLAPYVSFISPRQMCRSEPQTPARVSFTRMAPGSTSGTGYSRRSNSPPYARSTATRPFISVLLLSWPAGLEHESVQGDSERRITQLGSHDGRGRLLDRLERIGPTLHDAAQDGSARNDPDGRVGRRRARPLLRELRDLDLPESRLCEHLPDRLRIVQAVGDRVEHGRVGREEPARRLVRDARDRVPGQRVPYVEEVLSARVEHAKRLADARGLVGEEHQPELAHHGVER